MKKKIETQIGRQDERVAAAAGKEEVTKATGAMVALACRSFDRSSLARREMERREWEERE